MGSVSTGIPTSWNIPLFWAVVDGTKAGNLTEPQRALLVGQMISVTAGTVVKGVAAFDVPIPIGSLASAQQQFGSNSMLANMFKAFFNSNTTQQIWCCPVADNGAGVAAVGNITITAVATAAGTFTVYIAGQKVQILCQTTDTITIVATNLAAAINAITTMPVVATSAVGVVTLTCLWKGLTGNDITIIPNYLGLNGGEITPTGLTFSIGAMATGTTAPTFTNTISAIQSLEYDYVCAPYNDAASMTVWNAEMGFNSGGRWNFTRQQYGLIVNANRDTFANLITWGTVGGTGAVQNSPVMSTLAVETTSPSPIWEWSAAYCALAALGFSADPARPLQTLEFIGVLPAPLQSRFTNAQLNSLTNTGLAIQTTAPDGNPMIMREQTQYQVNSFGQGDTAFGLLTIIATLQELLRRMKSAITSKYPRVKLIPDGTKIGPGQAAVTPTDVKAELISEYSAAMFDGLCSDMSDFKANLIVQIDSVDPNQLNVLWPPQLAGQLRSFQALAQFRLLYPPQALN